MNPKLLVDRDTQTYRGCGAPIGDGLDHHECPLCVWQHCEDAAADRDSVCHFCFRDWSLCESPGVHEAWLGECERVVGADHRGERARVDFLRWKAAHGQDVPTWLWA